MKALFHFSKIMAIAIAVILVAYIIINLAVSFIFLEWFFFPVSGEIIRAGLLVLAFFATLFTLDTHEHEY